MDVYLSPEQVKNRTQLSSFTKNLMSEKYTIIKQINKGTYGYIYDVKNKFTGQIFVCKKILISNEIIYCTYNELIAWHKFDHPNIIKFYDAYCEKDIDNINDYACYIIMEKCDTSLYDLLIIQQKKINSDQKLQFLEQIISSLIYMWQKGYVHNDLSLSNILVKNDQIKIIDFGFIYNRSFEQSYYHTNTKYIQPPELIVGDVDTCDPDKIDIWALGQIFYAICYNDILFHQDSDRYYCDLISKMTIPSIQILKKYNIINKYEKLYSKFILNIEYSKNLINLDISMAHLDELILYNKEKTNFTNCLSTKSDENKFLKKLINWNVNQRPNIIETYYLYCKIFCKKNDNIQRLIDNFKMFNHLNSNNDYTLFKEYSFKNLQSNMLGYVYLFGTKRIFKIHYSSTIIENIDCLYVCVIKTLYLMSQIWQQWIYHPTKKDIIKNILEFSNCSENYWMFRISILENNFDRFYSFVNIINYHYNKFDTYLISKKIIDVDCLADLQYNFIKLLDLKIITYDAWDLFIHKKINKIYHNYFKFLYYLFLSSPLIVTICNDNILSALLLLIIGYHDELIQKKMVSQFGIINKIMTFDRKPNLEISNNGPCSYKKNNIAHEIDLNIVDINSVTIAYYFLWLTKKISKIYYYACANKLSIDNNFLEYINNFFIMIH